MRCCCAMLQSGRSVYTTAVFSVSQTSATCFGVFTVVLVLGWWCTPADSWGACTAPQSPSRCSWLHLLGWLLVQGQEELELLLVWVFEACRSELARALSGVIALSFRETIECQLKGKTDVALLQKYLSSKGVKLFIKTWTLGSSWFHGASSL